MSKKLGISTNASEIRAYKIRIVCSYLMQDKPIEKEAELEINTTSRDLAINLAIEKAKKQLSELPYIKNVCIKVLGKQRGRR